MMFHFAFPGELRDMMKSEVGNVRGFLYQTYDSDDFNIIAWQDREGIVGLLIGQRGAPEMAGYARDFLK
jgi:hypothetical protein